MKGGGLFLDGREGDHEVGRLTLGRGGEAKKCIGEPESGRRGRRIDEMAERAWGVDWKEKHIHGYLGTYS